MKKKLYSIVESMKFAIVLLLVGSIFTSFSNIHSDNTTVATLINAIVFFGRQFKELFPLAVVINYLGHRHEDSIVVITGIVSYVLLNVITIFYSSASLPTYFYRNILGLEFSTASVSGTIIQSPLNMGIIGSGIVVIIAGIAYRSSRKRYNYGILTFVDNDAWFLILDIILTIVAGVIVVWQYPFCANLVIKASRVISLNRTNPACMFIFAVMDKVLSVLGMHNIVEDSFWTGILGGSWTTTSGITYLGDINIWTAQLAADSLARGTGRFVTYNYIINIFVIPAIVVAYYINIDNKIDRRRTLGLAIVVILASLLSGASLPVEVYLFFTAPGILIIHIILSGIISMVLGILNIQLGYTLTGSLSAAPVGNLVDFIKYFQMPNHHSTVVILMIIGAISFVVYLAVVFLYYHVLSRYFLEPENAKVENMKVLVALGGISNVEMITSTPSSIVVVLNDKEKIDIDALLAIGAYKVRERYFGYFIDYGPGSANLCRQLRKEIKAYNDCMEFHSGV